MSRTRAHARIESLLNLAGVNIDGDAPSDIRVHDPQLYSRILAHGSLGLGEAYMDGWWDADDLDGFLFRLLDTRLDERVGGFEDAWLYVKARFLNLQRGRRAYVVGEHHYDLGNDLFQAMLGKRLVYSCGYWKDAADLDVGAGSKARPDFPQTRSGAGHACARHRLRLGRSVEIRRGTLRRIRRRCHRVAGTSRLRAGNLSRPAGRNPARRLPDARRAFRPGFFHRHVRARRRQELQDVFRRRAALHGGRRPVRAAHDRLERIVEPHRSVDREIHLSRIR